MCLHPVKLKDAMMLILLILPNVGLYSKQNNSSHLREKYRKVYDLND